MSLSSITFHLILLLHLFIYSWGRWWAHSAAHIQRSENNLSIMWLLGIELRLSELAAGTLMPEATQRPLVLVFMIYLLVCGNTTLHAWRSDEDNWILQDWSAQAFVGCPD